MTSPRSFPLASRLAPGLVFAAALLPMAAFAQTVAPKVMVITMFGEEAKPWLEARDLDTLIAVPGLSQEYPEVACDTAGLCVMTTAMGFANAASSTAAVVLSGLFDLSETYFLIDGIAGVDPEDATIGSALWADYVVDGGLRHDIDPRQIPAGWTTGMVALGAKEPGQKPAWSAGTEVYRLNPALVAKAYDMTRGVELADGDTAKAYRATYDQLAARAAPVVKICATASIDTYWHGSLTAEGIEDWTGLVTDGAANYCTTQMEDNATLTALRRGADAGLLDFDRVAVLRTASNFDREPAGVAPIDSLTANSGGFGPSIANAYRVGSVYADAIIADWTDWSGAAPK